MNDKKPTTTGTIRTHRQVLRRRRRERQIIVFGVLLIALGAVAFSAASVYSGRTSAPVANPIYTRPADVGTDITLACPQEVPAVEPSTVVVRVLNSTQTQGLAGNALQVLVGRGYVSGGATNWPRPEYEGGVRISFGDEGVENAYSVGRHFTQVEYVQDTRPGTSVDVVLGAEFDPSTSIRPLYAPELDPDELLVAPGRCLPAHLVPEEPAPEVVPAELEPTASPSPSGSES